MNLTENNSSWIEINAQALKNNLKIFRNIIGKKTLLGTVLKSNAYGHGLREVLPVIHNHIDLIHVISSEDALCIRKLENELSLSHRRILLIGPVDKHHLSSLIENDIELTCYGQEFLSLFEGLSLSQKAKVHIHIDTGLGREGFSSNNIQEEIEPLIKLLSQISVIGIMSHFANTEDVTDQLYAREQISSFNKAIDYLEKTYPWFHNIEKHFAASAATMLLPDARYDSIRMGIALYGQWPSRETKLSYNALNNGLPELQPVLSWKVKSQIIKNLPANSYVGYGCTYKCESPTRVAVLPVGYFDGYARNMSGIAHVLVHGHRCRVIGRIMMNHTVIDISTLSDQNQEITATLIGQDGKEYISAEMMGAWSGTINYEVLARIGQHLPRFLT